MLAAIMEILVDTMIPFGRNSVKGYGWLVGIFFPSYLDGIEIIGQSVELLFQVRPGRAKDPAGSRSDPGLPKQGRRKVVSADPKPTAPY